MLLKRLIWLAIALAIAAFAVQGGEYGTTDLLAQRARRRAVLAEIDTLTRHVDSLSRLKRRLASDAALQERVAREEYGMVRGDRELLYWLTEPRARRGASGDSAR